MKLYEINAEIRALWQKIIDQDGELTPEDISALESISALRDEKITAYGVVIRETLADIESLNEEKARLAKLEKTLNNKVEWLTNRLSEFMTENEMEKFNSVEVNISFRQSERLEIDEGAKIAKKWLRTKTEIDKKAIKEFISAGGKVKGCKIVTNQNIQIK